MLGLISLMIIVGRALPDPGQLIFWKRYERTSILYIFDSQRMMTMQLSNSPSPLVARAPRTTRDGRVVVYETLREGRFAVYLEARGRNLVYTTGAEQEDRLPSLSPDGRRLAMWSSETPSYPQYQTWYLNVLDVESLTMRRLTHQNGILPYDLPSWSPDGRYLLVRYWQLGGKSGIHILDTEIGSIRSLLHHVDSSADIIWSPDSLYLAFRSLRDYNLEIYLVNLADETLQNLTLHPADDYQPAWSLDSRTIAFASNRDGARQIYLMNPNGTNIRQLTQTNGWKPIWSPVGDQLVFRSLRDGRETLNLIRADGSGERFIADINYQIVFAGWFTWNP
jgi:Tol biopolymer transport system component